MKPKNFNDLEQYVEEIRAHIERIKKVPHRIGGNHININSDVKVKEQGHGTLLYVLTSSANYSPNPFAVYESTEEEVHRLEFDGTFPPEEEISELTERINSQIKQSYPRP